MEIDNLALYKFMEQLRRQCRFSQFAFQNVKSSLNGLDPEKVFFYARAFLFHAQAISRFLWPDRPESSARGERIRSELKITETSSLRMKGFRPQLEQEDERFEDWLGALENRNFVDMNLMPTAAISDFKPDSFQWSLDPDTFRFHLRGLPCELKPMAEEIRHLENAIQTWVQTHNPW